jgi:uncharacterized protein (DUF305 family)
VKNRRPNHNQPEVVKDLCKNIIASQQAEIDQMKAKLAQIN